jgi:hypothetical protein
MAQKKATAPTELQKYLKGVDYPASKETLRSTAENNGAPQDVLDVIDELPDEEYDAPTAVQKAFAEVEQ